MTDTTEKNTLCMEDLQGFYGTERYWSTGSPLHPFVYTDGVKYLVHRGSAFWLLDAIASWQRDPRILNDEDLQDMQFWNLKVHENSSALLQCERDTDDVVIEQTIPFTDFPLPQIRLYLAHIWCAWESHPNEHCVPSPKYGVLLLPSEY